MLNDKKVPFTPPILLDNNLLMILVKTPISLILFLQNSAQLFKITVFSTHQLFPLSISTWQTLRSRRTILKESSVNSMLIKLMVMIWSVFCMLIVSGDVIIETLFKIFKNCLKCRIFSDDCEKENIVPIFKKGDKQNIKDYRPVSLLPICSNLFERIICDKHAKILLRQ